MANDSISNRITNDSNLTYRQNRFESQDVSRMSFFDQLLSASNFQSDFTAEDLQPTNNLPSTAGFSASDSPSSIASNEKDDREKSDTNESDEAASQDNYAGVLAPLPTTLPTTPTDNIPVENQDEGTYALASGDSQTADTAAGSRQPSSKNDSIAPISPAQGPKSPQGDYVVSQENTVVGQQIKESPKVLSETQQADSQVSTEATELAKVEPVESVTSKKGRGNSNEESDAIVSNRPEVKAETLVGAQNGSIAVSDTRHASEQGEKSADSFAEKAISETVEQPSRNRRSERLASRTGRDGSTGDNESNDASSSADKLSKDTPDLVAELSQPSSDPVNAIDASATTGTSLGSIQPVPVPGFLNAAVVPTNITTSINPREVATDAASSITASSSVQASTVVSALGSTESTQSTDTTISSTSSTSTTNSSRGESVRGASGTTLSPYQETKLVQRVLRGLEQLGDGGGQVKLRLHPPELGTLQMTLRIHAGQMHAHMEVENGLAKDALLSNVQTLRDRLAEQGMRIESFDVDVNTNSGNGGASGSNQEGRSGFGEDSRWNNTQSRFAQMNSNRLSSEATITDKPSTQTWNRNHGSLDLTV